MQRKLTVIFSADVVGYSGLMERDEAGTLERLKENRARLFDPCVARHGGRIFKLMGDGVLVEFSSAAAAVGCALEIQQAMGPSEAAVAEGKRLSYRVGINLGDVIVEGDDIYGEGVNVAARLQALAPAGGIALSRNVADQVAGKVPAAFEDLGQHTVKNIERPVHVFLVRSPDVAPALHASAKAGAAATSAQRSICVLPFTNISGDPEQEYFSDGISEDIITDLSKVSALYVAARNTSFMFKGKNVDVPQVARQLKVSHVLEGSVRKAGNRVRITAQLIDGASGGHLWAERWDRDLDDIFALQDEISEAIVRALKLKLMPEEKRAIEHRGTTNAKAYKYLLMARQISLTGNMGNARRDEAIIRLCRRATELDPQYAQAWAMLGGGEAGLKIYHDRPGGDGGLGAVERALAIDPKLADGHAVKARILAHGNRLEEALAEVELALALDPESYEVNASAGRVYYALRRYADAIRCWEKAVVLAESDYHVCGLLISCYDRLGDQESLRRAAHRTLARAERIVAIETDNGSAMSFIVTALASLGEQERAKDWIERAMLFDPDNVNMIYNFACTLASNFRDADGALELLEPSFETIGEEALNWSRNDSDLDSLRELPRFKAMIAKAEARLAKS